MSNRAALALAACLVLATPGLAGCLGDDSGASDTGTDDRNTSDGAAPADADGRLIATSNVSFDLLALATYDNLDPGPIEERMPEGFEPVECFPPRNNGTLDATLFVSQASYPGLEEVPGDVVERVTLWTCAERPEGLARENATEVPWFSLFTWYDPPEMATFLSDEGLEARPADLSFTPTDAGFAFEASQPDGAQIAQGAFGTPPTGSLVGPQFTRCQDLSQRGRSILSGPNSTIGALDWQWDETVCPATAEIQWPSDGTLAEVLGPVDEAGFAFHVDIPDGQRAWRILSPPT